MSHNSLTGFDQPLRVELQASRIILSVLAALYGLAAFAWLWVPLAWPGRAGLYVLLGWHFIHLYRLHVDMSAKTAVQALSWDRMRGWQIRCARDGWLQAEPCLPVFISYRLAAVRFKAGRFKTRRVIVVGDRLGSDDFRRLRVRLLQSTHGAGD
jgi:hypothetical protein